MPEYLSKEEIKQWRSSLEKITLEEYAARLGKVIEEEKHTNDLIDIVLKGQPITTGIDSFTQTRGEKLNAIAERAFTREKEITNSPFSSSSHSSISSMSINDKKISGEKAKKSEKPIIKAAIESKKTVEKTSVEKSSGSTQGNSTQRNSNLRDDVRLVFNKALTDREQLVFDYFANNKNQIVYAKDLAKLLDLPRDYVYKYIKNLRTKIEGDKLQNADNGGYVLTV